MFDNRTMLDCSALSAESNCFSHGPLGFRAIRAGEGRPSCGVCATVLVSGIFPNACLMIPSVSVLLGNRRLPRSRGETSRANARFSEAERKLVCPRPFRPNLSGYKDMTVRGMRRCRRDETTTQSERKPMQNIIGVDVRQARRLFPRGENPPPVRQRPARHRAVDQVSRQHWRLPSPIIFKATGAGHRQIKGDPVPAGRPSTRSARTPCAGSPKPLDSPPKPTASMPRRWRGQETLCAYHTNRRNLKSRATSMSCSARAQPRQGSNCRPDMHQNDHVAPPPRHDKAPTRIIERPHMAHRPNPKSLTSPHRPFAEAPMGEVLPSSRHQGILQANHSGGQSD